MRSPDPTSAPPPERSASDASIDPAGHPRAGDWTAHGRVVDIDVLLNRLAQQDKALAEGQARLAQTLAEAEHDRRQAHDANQAQARFLAHMSHELRTPLAGLLGLVDLARRVASNPAQQRYLDVAMQSGRTLQRTIDDVLDLTRLREGGLPLADEDFDVAEALAEVLRGEMPLVRSKGLSMRFDWVGKATWGRGDELRLRQIVANLVGNAAKFTERGHVALKAELRPLAGQPQRLQLRLVVEDTGPGVPAERAAQIFDDFVQGDASLTRAHGGSGLGLPIARELTARMGGELVLDSQPGVGSSFVLTLPLGLAQDPNPVLPAPAGQAWLVYQRRDIGEWLQHRLARLGWHAELLPDVAAATARGRALAPAQQPPLVVLAEHVLLPGTDLAGLRQALPHSHISLLVRPDWDQPELERSGAALDMVIDVMPLTPRALAQMTADRSAPPPPAAPVPALGGHVLVVEDNAINRMIAQEFLCTLGFNVQAVEDGAQALAACAAAPPRLVLMDLQMPVMDGLSATRALCQRQQAGELPQFPIVALTAHAMSSDAQACRAAGMSGFLTKPLLLDALRAELQRWCPELAAGD